VTPGEPILEARGIRLSFGGVAALKGVSFTLREHDFFAIIGPNGAGKTSLLNVLNGVYAASSGEIRFQGHLVTGRKPSDIARLGIARTFQNVALFEDMTVLDNVILGRHHLTRSGVLTGALWWGRARREEYEARRECLPLLELMGLSDLRNDRVAGLSYGVKKRIELARALAMRPSLLLLDEPVAGLNDAESDELGEWLLAAKRELSLTIVMIEHDMKTISRLADLVLVLDFGEVVSCEPPADVMRNPLVIDAYLGRAASTDGADPVDAADRTAEQVA
jgi:branched-chain amino acid transport system ATP-binding protein